MALQYETVSTSTVTNASSLTYALNNTGFTNCLLVVGVCRWGVSAPSVSSITYHAVALTSGVTVSNATNNTGSALFYLANPDIGNNNVVITMSASCLRITGGAVLFSGVDQASPKGNTGTSTQSGGSTVNIGTAGSMAISAEADNEGNTHTYSGVATKRWDDSFNGSGATSGPHASTGNQTHTQNQAGTAATVIMEVKAASGGGAAVVNSGFFSLMAGEEG